MANQVPVRIRALTPEQFRGLAAEPAYMDNLNLSRAIAHYKITGRRFSTQDYRIGYDPCKYEETPVGSKVLTDKQRAWLERFIEQHESLSTADSAVYHAKIVLELNAPDPTRIGVIKAYVRRQKAG